MTSASTQLRPVKEPMDTRWAEIKHWTMEACVLRAEGREAAALRVLQERMPALIRDWSEHCGLVKPAAQELLRRMFAETQEFIARGMTQRRLITAMLMTDTQGEIAATSARVSPASVAARTTVVGLRRHVPVADIEGMLDGLAEAEHEARREALWPLRSHATYAAASL